MNNYRKHFSLEEWADFSRGRTAGETRIGMLKHLEGGCDKCAHILQLWNTVLGMASREESFLPPANSIRCAKALYAAMPPWRASKFSLRMAHLAGFNRLALQGVRSAAPAPVHFLFKEGALQLDMYLQPQTSSGLVSMVGQVLDSTQPDKRFENQPVAVMLRNDTLARTNTNEFGEFRLEFRPDQDLLLTIELENGSCLISPLPPPQAG